MTSKNGYFFSNSPYAQGGKSYNSDYYTGCGLIIGLPNFKYGRITALIFVRSKNSFVLASSDG